MWKLILRKSNRETCDKAQRLQQARELAQRWCQHEGSIAEIRDRKGRLRMRYWRDREGLQYLEY